MQYKLILSEIDSGFIEFLLHNSSDEKFIEHLLEEFLNLWKIWFILFFTRVISSLNRDDLFSTLIKIIFTPLAGNMEILETSEIIR